MSSSIDRRSRARGALMASVIGPVRRLKNNPVGFIPWTIPTTRVFLWKEPSPVGMMIDWVYPAAWRRMVSMFGSAWTAWMYAFFLSKEPWALLMSLEPKPFSRRSSDDIPFAVMFSAVSWSVPS